ncbi:hypothetical protein LCGC14_2266290 [marine sediment metagenome]|uniref:Uncharacterized protein n=1 Tax=marine sediment metagenome TaxID=412755 RepID=A0A0F9CYD9_9ZZZZ
MRYIVAAVLFAAASLAYWYMIPTFAIRWVAVSGLCVLGAGLLGSHVWRGRVLAPSRADWAGMAFIGWITLSLAWSSDQQAGAYQLMYIAMMYGVFLTVEHGLSKWRETLPDLICVIFAGALALLGWENRVHGGFGNPNWAVEWLLIASPFVALRKWAWPLLVLAVVYMLWFNNSKAEFIALWLVAVFGLLLLRWWITAPIVFIAPFTAAALWPEMVTEEDMDRIADAVAEKISDVNGQEDPQRVDQESACPNLRPMEEWVTEDDPDSCRPCVLPVAMSWYAEELRERGLNVLADEVDQAGRDGDVAGAARALDSVKERVDPDVKTRLLEFDCATQSNAITSDETAFVSPGASSEPSPPDHHSPDTE